MRGQFHTTEKLGPRRELTPEGFLICYDVPLARTGDQLYGGSELGPIVPDSRGLVVVERTADAVFSPRTIASANGKSFVVGHPVKGDPTRPGHDVNPQNWRDVSCGTIVNPRRGEGALVDFLVGDIVVSVAEAIREITVNDTTEISLGYTADYEQISPGRARQHNIVINHAALVDQGRCGPRCAIGDEDMRTRDEQPKKTLKERVTGTIEALVAGLGTNDRKIVDASVEALRRDVGEIGEPGSGASVVINTGAGPSSEGTRTVVTADAAALADVTTRLGRLETVIARVAPSLEKLIKTRDDADDDEEDDPENPGKKRKKVKTTDSTTVRDSAHLRTEFDDVVARAEILSPGTTPPAFDAKAQEVRTLDSVCGFRRSVLTRAWGTADGRAIIEPMLGGAVANFASTLDGMKCPEVRILFNGASETARRANNSAVSGARTTDSARTSGKRLTAADINAMNRKEHGQPDRG